MTIFNLSVSNILVLIVVTLLLSWQSVVKIHIWEWLFCPLISLWLFYQQFVVEHPNGNRAGTKNGCAKHFQVNYIFTSRSPTPLTPSFFVAASYVSGRGLRWCFMGCIWAGHLPQVSLLCHSASLSALFPSLLCQWHWLACLSVRIQILCRDVVSSASW